MKTKRYFSHLHSALSAKYIIKKICAYMYVIFPFAYVLSWLHYLFFRKKKQYKYEVSICLIFKNEAAYLKEWIEYHLLIGVDHFYLYNNLSEDNYMEILAPYIEKGLVTLTEWPVKYAQIAAYEDCYNRCKDETHWLGYIDADEFVNLQRDNSIKVFLLRYKVFPSILLCWKMFGTSGIVKEPKNYLVTEAYVASWPWLCTTGKSFINNDYIFRHIKVHYDIAFVAGIPLYGVTDTKIFAPFMIHPFSFNRSPIAYINHYWSRSREYYIYKDMYKGDVASMKNETIKKKTGRFEFHELNNSVHDYSIQRWLVLLKERIAEL